MVSPLGVLMLIMKLRERSSDFLVRSQVVQIVVRLPSMEAPTGPV